MVDDQTNPSAPRRGRFRSAGRRRRRDESPELWLGRGMAWLVFDAGRDTYHCYWLVGPADDHVVEYAKASSAVEAVEWARNRTPRARIRLPDHRTYWAGTGPSPGGFAGTWPVGTLRPLTPRQPLEPFDTRPRWALTKTA